MGVYAIVLAGGAGHRMGSDIRKQYLELNGLPMICHSLKVMEDTPEADSVILVAAPGDELYCRENIVSRYGYTKVSDVIAGGKERYHSVYEGLKKIQKKISGSVTRGGTDFVIIHDGARPMLTRDIILRTLRGAEEYGACVAAVPVKDTIKLADEKDFVSQTIDRSRLRIMQTPQTFAYPLILTAYSRLISREEAGEKVSVTDDAMVVETCFPEARIKLALGSYENIKVTTPEDLILAENFLKNGIKFSEKQPMN